MILKFVDGSTLEIDSVQVDINQGRTRLRIYSKSCTLTIEEIVEKLTEENCTTIKVTNSNNVEKTYEGFIYVESCSQRFSNYEDGLDIILSKTAIATVD